MKREQALDHVVVFHEDHLRRLPADYVAYFHEDRTIFRGLVDELRRTNNRATKHPD